jgi:hypothetical protein
MGYILVYREFPEAFIREQGNLPTFLEDRYRGGPAAVMLVDYHTSPVGPYREALFIPGQFDINGRRLFSVTAIYVSTPESVIGGRTNWGLPKQLASFSIEKVDKRTRRFQMHVDDNLALDVQIRAQRIALPLSTRLMPLQPALIQKHDDNRFITAPVASGRAGFADLELQQVDADYFPDFTPFDPFQVIHAPHFKMTFPVPELLDNAVK